MFQSGASGNPLVVAPPLMFDLLHHWPHQRDHQRAREGNFLLHVHVLNLHWVLFDPPFLQMRAPPV